MPDGCATPYRAAGRAIAIAELLRAGYKPSDVAKALELIDQGDREGALALLLPLKSKAVS